MRNAVVALLALSAPALAQTVTVAALGDSLTAGYGLPQHQGFVARLQAWLDARDAGVEVVGAGVSGDTTAGGLSRFDWTVTSEVDAVIVALGGNDFLRAIDPAVSRANLRGILEKAAEKDLEVLLIGVDASANYGPAYEAAFDAMYPELAAEFGALVEPDWFGALRPPGATLADAMGGTLQGDGIHPSAAGVDLIVERLGPRVLELAEAARR